MLCAPSAQSKGDTAAMLCAPSAQSKEVRQQQCCVHPQHKVRVIRDTAAMLFTCAPKRRPLCLHVEVCKASQIGCMHLLFTQAALPPYVGIQIAIQSIMVASTCYQIQAHLPHHIVTIASTSHCYNHLHLTLLQLPLSHIVTITLLQSPVPHIVTITSISHCYNHIVTMI